MIVEFKSERICDQLVNEKDWETDIENDILQLGLGSLENEKWEKGRSEIKNEIDTVSICYNWICVVVSAWEEHEW